MSDDKLQQNIKPEADIVPGPLLPKTIDAFIGENLHRMFGKDVVEMFTADRKRIPGVDIHIHNKPMGNYTEVTVVFLFHNKEIDRKKIFAI